MQKNLHRTLSAFSVGITLLGGCLGGGTSTTTGGGKQTGGGEIPVSSDPATTNPSTNPTPVDPNQLNLDARVIDYGQAARTASVKLVGELPTLDELATVNDAASYAALVDKYLADPRFSRQMVSLFQDQMKVGAPGSPTAPSRDTAPTFAAKLAATDGDFRKIFTATAGTCPTLDAATGAFTDGDCPLANGLVSAGVLTDPGVMASMYSNMAFRRVRWVQETFLCQKFPAEFSASGGVQKGAGTYVSPWPFESISGGAMAKVDFHDTSAVICANCHATMNHIAPLFASFDSAGVFQTSIQVKVPVEGNPTATLADYLPAMETTAYRFGKPVASLIELGTALAADPATAECEVARLWNWAMDKGEIVNAAAVVPTTTIDKVLTAYRGSNYHIKAALKAILTSDDFVKF